MKRIILFLALVISLLRFSQAQPALGIDSVVVTPDTVNFGESVTIFLNVVNTGDSAFFGNIIFHYLINNNFLGSEDTTNNALQLNSGQTIQVIFPNHIIEPPMYAVGDNIVVIWPVASFGNALTSDSITTHIIVDTLLGIGSPGLKDQIKVFFKTSDRSLYIDYGNFSGRINEVTCYSILGEQVANYNYAVNEISFGESSPQIFLLVIRTKEGETISFKILRM